MLEIIGKVSQVGMLLLIYAMPYPPLPCDHELQNSTIKAQHVKVLNKICFHYGFASEKQGRDSTFAIPMHPPKSHTKNPIFRFEAIC
jgi:hypothetical protein